MDLGTFGKELFQVFDERIWKGAGTILAWAAYIFLIGFFLKEITAYAVWAYGASDFILSGKALAALQAINRSVIWITLLAVAMTIFIGMSAFMCCREALMVIPLILRSKRSVSQEWKGAFEGMGWLKRVAVSVGAIFGLIVLLMIFIPAMVYADLQAYSQVRAGLEVKFPPTLSPPPPTLPSKPAETPRSRAVTIGNI